MYVQLQGTELQHQMEKQPTDAGGPLAALF